MANYNSDFTGVQIDDSVGAIKNAVSAFTNSGASTVTADDLTIDNIKIDGNTITSEDTNGNINLTPNGTGYTILNGSVGIGETVPLGKCHIKTGDSGASSVGASADELVIEGSAHSGMTIISGTTGQGLINFADSGDANVGNITYDHDSNFMSLKTNDSERLRIDSSGNVDIHEGLQVGGLYTEHAVVNAKSQFTLTWSAGSYDGGYFKIIVSGRPNAFGDAYMESVYSWATATGNVGAKAFTSILAVGETLSVGSETIPIGSGSCTVRIDASDTINNGHIIIQSTEPISLTQA